MSRWPGRSLPTAVAVAVHRGLGRLFLVGDLFGSHHTLERITRVGQGQAEAVQILEDLHQLVRVVELWDEGSQLP